MSVYYSCLKWIVHDQSGLSTIKVDCPRCLKDFIHDEPMLQPSACALLVHSDPCLAVISHCLSTFHADSHPR
eukprot:scaffold673174_cov71-Attheya_sp.AAC.3